MPDAIAAAGDAQERAVAALIDAVVAISSDLDLEEVLGRIVRTACQLVGARYGALGVLSPAYGGLAEFIAEGLSDEERRSIGLPPEGHGILGVLIDDPRPLRLDDLAAHPRSVGFPPGHPPMRSFLGAPIRVGGEVFGNLYLTQKAVGGFSAEDEQVVVALAAATGVAIDNARLYATAERQRRWSEAIARMSRSLLRGERPRRALDDMASDAAEVAQAALAVVALCEEGEGPLVIESVVGPDARAGAVMVGSLLGSAHWRDVLALREPLLLVSRSGEDLADPPAGALRQGAGLQRHGATALAPIVAGERAYGLLVVGWGEGNEALAAENIEPLGRYARQAGLTLAAASSQRDRARTGILEERDRIARDMHDLVIQRVYATGVSLHVLRGRVDDPFVAERIDSAVDELDRAIKEIRSTIFELHRTSEQGQVAAELAQVVGDVVATLGFAPALTVTGDLDGMPEPLAHDVVAVVREALVNVVRHAQASRVAVTVEARPVAVPAPLSRGGESERSRGTGGAGKSADPSEPAGERSADAAGSDGPRRSMVIRVVVADDGTGLPPRLERRSGLANLAERAIRDGGALDLSPAPRGGTVLTWTGWHDG